MKNYLKLEQEIEKIFQINNAIKILNWDIATNIPLGSVNSRTTEITTLSLISKNILKSTELSNLLDKAKKETQELNNWQLANIIEVERSIQRALCIDDGLEAKIINATTQCEVSWRKARADNDFVGLKPLLQLVVDCTKEIADIKSKKLNVTPYDSLIDIYDPGRKNTEIKKTFDILKQKLPDLIGKIIDKQRTEKIIDFKEKISVAQQKLIAKKLMDIMGFDFNCGRLDESTHPFSGGTAFDVRLTNRYDENDLLSGIMGVIHETGHGLYEQNLPQKYKNQFVGKARGMAMHESQSLFMEMQIGRSREFIEFLAKLLRDEFNLIGEEYSSENLYKLTNRVKHSYIRVDADEVTYPMHVILRYDIEDAILNNELDISELPKYWNAKMQEYLKLVPDSDKNGCLQDIHWPSGNFGYFPAYTNGAIIASMLMNKVKTLCPEIKQEILSGNFQTLNSFLNKNIRGLGSSKNVNQLLKDITGEEHINANIYLNYLEQKYLDSYNESTR